MNPRHQAREAALRILYFCDVGRARPDDAILAFFEEHAPDANEATRAFAARLVHGTIESQGDLDALISQHSQHWRLERLAIMDRLILRMGIWELQHEPDVPAAVVLNEAIELARTYSSDASIAFVNGVLDGVRKSLGGPRP